MNTVVSNFPEGFYSKSFLELNLGNGNADLYPHLGTHVEMSNIHQNIQNFFDISKRIILRDVFLNQYQSVDLSPKQAENIDLLLKNETFTITTGQQIHVGLGPMYVWNKIVSVLNTVKVLSDQFPENHYVPIFWMASEDHDFDEIKHVHFLGKDYTWQTNQTGAVGHFHTNEIDLIFQDIHDTLQLDETAKNRLREIQNIYKKSVDLSEATRKLVQLVFGNTGLLVLDPNDTELKVISRKIWIQDIINRGKKNPSGQSSLDLLNLHQKTLLDYGIEPQVYLREINCFCLDQDVRERIEVTNNEYKRVQSGITYSETEMKGIIENFPQKISPNVILRPIYQQNILPNAVYIGGPAEIKYWMQMSPLFDLHQVPCPRLQLRLSNQFLPKSVSKKISKLGLEPDNFWLNWADIAAKIEQNNADKYTFDDEIAHLEQNFEIIWQTLYSLQNKDLKQFKSTHIGILKELKKVSREYKDNPETGIKLLKDLKTAEGLKTIFFNDQQPQERVLHWIEIFVLYGEISLDFIDDCREMVQFLRIQE